MKPFLRSLHIPLLRCIYCGAKFDSQKGEGDHVLPLSVFGEFKPVMVFRGCCPRCNNESGAEEQILSQSTPIGLYRWLVKPFNSRRTSSFRQRGAKGERPPKFVMWFNEIPLLVEPTEANPIDAHPVDQVVLMGKDGAFEQVRIFPNMKADRFAADVVRTGIADPKSVYVNCDPSLTEHINRLLGGLFPGMNKKDFDDIQPGTHQVRGRAEFRFGVGYFQAIAKIALHYYLLNNRRGFCGHEPIFADIKNFVKHGGELQRFFQPHGQEFSFPYKTNDAGEVLCPENDWFHFLFADDQRERIVVCFRYYVGPRSLPEPIYITLGSLSGWASVPKALGRFGHAFQLPVATASSKPGFAIPMRID